MVRVLFVCLGNICRSPLAEGIFKDLVKQKSLEKKIFADSAGTSGYHIGADPDHRSCKVASNYKIVLEHRARKFIANDFDGFDYIIPMDRSNLEFILKLKAKKKIKAKVFLMRAFDSDNAPDKDVPDPYYDELEGFEKVYLMLARSCQHLLEYIITEANLHGTA